MYRENEKNLGYDGNLNQLVRTAQGKWLVFMGDDDEFIPGALDKLRAVRQRIDRSGRDIWLEVDGGVKTENIAEIARAGADTFVAGSAIFGTRDYKAAITAMRFELAKSGP